MYPSQNQTTMAVWESSMVRRQRASYYDASVSTGGELLLRMLSPYKALVRSWLTMATRILSPTWRSLVELALLTHSLPF